MQCDPDQPMTIPWAHGNGEVTFSCVDEFGVAETTIDRMRVKMWAPSDPGAYVTNDGNPEQDVEIILTTQSGIEVQDVPVEVTQTRQTWYLNATSDLLWLHLKKQRCHSGACGNPAVDRVVFFEILLWNSATAVLPPAGAACARHSTAPDICAQIGYDKSTACEPPAACAEIDCECSCCAGSGNCLAAGQGFRAGMESLCTRGECAKHFYECFSDPDEQGAGYTNTPSYTSREACDPPTPPPPCGQPDCECSCCFAEPDGGVTR